MDGKTSNSKKTSPKHSITRVVEGRSLNILVRSFTGSIITVPCDETNTVGHIAQQVLDYEDYKRNQTEAIIWGLELTLGGRVLEPASKLVENGIREMSTIKCMLVSK